MWFVYMVRCSDDTFYTGITNDIEKRISEHNNGKNAAKYTRSRRPVDLVYKESVKNKNDALKRECVIKSFTRSKKEALIGQFN